MDDKRVDVEAIRKRYNCAYADGGPHPLADVGTILTELTRLQALVEWRTDWENAPKDDYICAHGFYRNGNNSRWEKIRWSTNINGWVDEEGYPFIAMAYKIITPPESKP